ncbi:MAE_28990/MAE_18760 family HEPN-like nuclease [Variovorax sp. PDC80]|uniref:MAE_28990/MAE_18760 family HEPN-like nuclease n=1 Tax=Variovorax sp. PDC80 TaxID=1882827 RepID=UPI001160BAB2|nr:MAE_28990/MAE_18760 family HEPN-like nuclease [Variovorax sp. PDC80]
MSKARSEAELSDELDADLTWRLKELSDLKQAIRDAPSTNRKVLLKALVALSYAHWEGLVKSSAQRYFDYITNRRLNYSMLERQMYVNSFLVRLAAFSNQKPALGDRINLVNEILESQDKRFSKIHPDLIHTGSNLKHEVLVNICKICGIDYLQFDGEVAFIDEILLKRRNAIAHGDDSVVAFEEIDHLVDGTIKLMRTFKNSLENKVYEKKYLANLI